MKHFLSTRFVEVERSGLFGGLYLTHELISIGLVSEDGNEYYGISRDFDLWGAWNKFDFSREWYSVSGSVDVRSYWVRDSILRPIFLDLMDRDDRGVLDFTFRNFRYLINKYGKTRSEIAEEVNRFYVNNFQLSDSCVSSSGDILHPEYYGYYCSYDWILLCSLFKSSRHSSRYRFYCRDLKQDLDNRVKLMIKGTGYSFDQYLEDLRDNKNYPMEFRNCNSLDNARWNRDLYNFLKQL